uniref:Core shell protein Gag P30 domain-containing protein n=1 Tax=Chelydra serpentina TaxID=8475 RepID=A0A8C3T884_CHESE
MYLLPSVSPSAAAPPPYKERVPRAPEIAPSVWFYPLITETVVARSVADNRRATTMQVYTHVPFNPVDLAAFRAQAGEFSTNTFISVFEGCLANHKPDWDDCNILMRTLLSEVERNQVVSKAREEAQRRHDRDIQYVPIPADMVLIADPRWNPNEPQDQTHLNTYKELLLHGLRHSAVHHNNWAKPYELIQEPKEIHSFFGPRFEGRFLHDSG